MQVAPTNSKEQEGYEFLATVAHELRNPLATILSSVELLRIDGAHPPETTELLQVIEERVHDMKNILNHLLEVSMLSQKLPSQLLLPVHKSKLLPAHYLRRSGFLRAGEHACSILIVDDNEIAARSLSQLLTRRGHAVAVAHTGARAIELAKELTPHIVILDIGLPDMDGYEVMRQLAQNQLHSQPTYIALTGYGQPQDKERTRKAGFDFHFTKPVALAEIEEALLSVPCGVQI